MFKQTIVAIVLMSLLVGNSWNTEAGSRRPPRSHNDQPVESKVREKRFFNPFPKLYSIWNALTHIYSLYVEQKNETYYALEQTYDIVADGFNDTYMSTHRPTTTTAANTDFGPVTSTEKYRISRKELGYILGRNYRGLKKLWNIEINDALNQSKYNIEEYRREKAWALYPYTIKKFPPPPNSTSSKK